MFKINDKNNTVTPATSLISHLFLSVYIVDFEKVNVCWVSSLVSDNTKNNYLDDGCSVITSDILKCQIKL